MDFTYLMSLNLSTLLEYSGFGVNTVIFFFSFLIAWRTFKNSVRQRINTDITNFLARNMEFNKRNEDNPFRQNAARIFIGMQSKSDEPEGEYSKKYNGVRYYLADIFNLSYQAWIITRMRGHLSGWNVIADSLIKEIYNANKDEEYYMDACNDFKNYIESGRFYSKKFIIMLKKRNGL